MYQPNLTVESIGSAFRQALLTGLIREEDTLVMFHDLSFLRERINHLHSVFPAGTLHAVAMKANPLLKILEFIRPLGAGAEVASLAELRMALKAGYPANKILFDSPAKTRQELEFALAAGVHINIDSLAELERVATLRQITASASTIGIHFAPSKHRQLFSASWQSLNTIDKVAARDPHPLVFTVRNRTVANVDSIGLVVRM